MSRLFDYDWFSGTPFEKQKEEARLRCTRKKFAKYPPADVLSHADARAFYGALEVRTLVYLRDGFSYEMKDLVDLGTRGVLTFECEPVDEQYRVGAFVVAVQFEEIVRLEIYAVHPNEKPEDTPLITGFRSAPGGSDMYSGRDEGRDSRDPRGDARDLNDSISIHRSRG
jgi:hypothetical protein